MGNPFRKFITKYATGTRTSSCTTKPITEMRKSTVPYNECGHKLLSYSLGYVAHSLEVERRVKRGQKARQCPKCGLWLFTDEMKTTDVKYINQLP